MLTLTDLRAILNVLEEVETELEQLIYDKEWFVTDVTEGITDAKERLKEAILEKQIY